jgi:hypothetical protein
MENFTSENIMPDLDKTFFNPEGYFNLEKLSQFLQNHFSRNDYFKDIGDENRILNISLVEVEFKEDLPSTKFNVLGNLKVCHEFNAHFQRQSCGNIPCYCDNHECYQYWSCVWGPEVACKTYDFSVNLKRSEDDLLQIEELEINNL